MEIAERRDEEMRESGNTENIKSDSFSDERYSRDLKAGLHPLRVCPLITYIQLILNLNLILAETLLHRSFLF